MSSKPLISEPLKALVSKSEQTRSLILAAAARLFRDQGYTASTLRKIAAAAGIEAGSIYYHFNSKDEILDEVLDLGLRQVFEAVKETRAACEAQGEGFREIFAAMVHTHLTYLLQASDFTSSNIRNFSMLPTAMRERHRPLRRAYADEWDDALGKALAAGSIRSDIKIVPLRQFVIGALNWTVEWFDANRYSIEIFSNKATELILDGMLTEPGKPVVEKIFPEGDQVNLLMPEGSKAVQTRSHILSSAAKHRQCVILPMRQVWKRAAFIITSVRRAKFWMRFSTVVFGIYSRALPRCWPMKRTFPITAVGSPQLSGLI